MSFASKCYNLLIGHTYAGSNNIITALVNKINENNFDIWIDFSPSSNMVGFEMQND